jgi:hypothetical protein
MIKTGCAIVGAAFLGVVAVKAAGVWDQLLAQPRQVLGLGPHNQVVQAIAAAHRAEEATHRTEEVTADDKLDAYYRWKACEDGLGVARMIGVVKPDSPDPCAVHYQPAFTH